MIKAKVSRNLKGTLMLPTVSSFALKANKEIYLSEEQLYASDIQAAITQHYLIIDGDAKRQVEMTEITNLSFSSISLPLANAILRAGKSIKVRADLLKRPEYKKMIKDGLIAENIIFDEPKEIDTKCTKIKISKKKEKQTKEPNIPVNMQIGQPVTLQPGVNKDGTGTATPVRTEICKKYSSQSNSKNAEKSPRRLQEESLLIDLDAKNSDNEDNSLIDPRTGKKVSADNGIIFVDLEKSHIRKK